MQGAETAQNFVNDGVPISVGTDAMQACQFLLLCSQCSYVRENLTFNSPHLNFKSDNLVS